MSFILSPLESYETYIIWNKFFFFFDISFTNILLYLFLILVFIVYLFLFSLKSLWLFPTNWQIIFENIYKFVLDLFRQQVQILHSFRFFPLFFVIFCFVLFANLMGLMPYSFTITAQILMNFTLAFSVVFGLSIFGFIYHGLNFIKFFIPSGVPVFLIPILFFIELISYCIRPLSLSARLFANLLAGHTLLNILSSFGLIIFKKYPVIFIVPFIFIFFVIVLEFCIAFIQAYVFLLLSLIYLGDIYNLNH